MYTVIIKNTQSSKVSFPYDFVLCLEFIFFGLICCLQITEMIWLIVHSARPRSRNSCVSLLQLRIRWSHLYGHLLTLTLSTVEDDEITDSQTRKHSAYFIAQRDTLTSESVLNFWKIFLWITLNVRTLLREYQRAVNNLISIDRFCYFNCFAHFNCAQGNDIRTQNMVHKFSLNATRMSITYGRAHCIPRLHALTIKT